MTREGTSFREYETYSSLDAFHRRDSVSGFLKIIITSPLYCRPCWISLIGVVAKALPSNSTTLAPT